MTSKSKPKKVGRPTKYRPEYCEQIIEHFDIPLYKEKLVEKMSASGAVKELKVEVPNSMPTFESFARKIGVLHETLADWTHKNPEFSVAYKVCKGIQKTFIVEHGLQGTYNPAFTKFFAINNLGMVDKSEVKTENEHTVDGPVLGFALDVKPEDL